MTKREYLIKLLDKLQYKWDFAKWLLLLVKNIDDITVLDVVFSFFLENINKLSNQKDYYKIQQVSNIIQKIKNLEKLEFDEEELMNLLDKI